MDSLTQIVLGAAVGEAVLGRKVGNKAMLYGAIAGTIPDLDALARFFTDDITAVEVHRGFTHSIVFSVLFAPVFGYLISRIHKQGSWREWSWLMFWGLFTHPILDSFTTWGTQLFWPAEIRLAFKNIFVIDPLYTLPFLFFLIMALPKKKQDPRRRRYNNLGIFISSGYLLLSIVLKGVAYVKFVDSLDRQGIYYQRIDTKPAPLNTILWTANVEVEDAYLIGDHSFLDKEEVIRFRAFTKNHHYLGPLKDDPNVKRLIKITQGWYTISEKDGHLYFNDLRFGQINPYDPDSHFTFSYKLLVENGKVRAEEVKKDRGDAKEVLSDLWERIKGK